MRGSFDFFWEQANTDVNSPGYGLIRDRYPVGRIASTASVGFGLTAYLVGIEKGYITTEQGAERTSKTLDTLLGMDREEGFYYHFVDMKTGKRAWESEVSSIDTAILMMGVLSVGEYFGGEIQTKAKQIYDEVNWPWFIDPARNMFYMAYRPGKGFEGYWDFYAEQLMLYVLAAGSDTHPVDDNCLITSSPVTLPNMVTVNLSSIPGLARYLPTNSAMPGSIFASTPIKRMLIGSTNSVEACLAQYNFATNMER